MKCKLNGNEIESLFPCSSNCPLFGDCLVQYEKESEKRSQPTNADRIRAMNDEELVKMLWKTGRNYRAVCADPVVDFNEYHDDLLDWLQQPAGEEKA